MTCTVAFKHKATRQEGVMNFHLCFMPLAIPYFRSQQSAQWTLSLFMIPEFHITAESVLSCSQLFSKSGQDLVCLLSVPSVFLAYRACVAWLKPNAFRQFALLFSAVARFVKAAGLIAVAAAIRVSEWEQIKTPCRHSCLHRTPRYVFAVAQPHEHSEIGKSAKNSQWLRSSACASTLRTSRRLLSKCRRHFSNSNTNFKFWELVSRRWKHSCNSNQPGLSKLSKREAR